MRFASSWSCSCGQKYGEHTTLFEDRNDRIARGKPVDNYSGPMSMGGMMSFQSLMDGADGY